MSDKLIETVARELHHAGWEQDYWTAAAKQVIAAIEASGYRVVPEEPTDEMRKAGFSHAFKTPDDMPADANWRPDVVYTAMLAAAPKIT